MDFNQANEIIAAIDPKVEVAIAYLTAYTDVIKKIKEAGYFGCTEKQIQIIPSFSLLAESDAKNLLNDIVESDCAELKDIPMGSRKRVAYFYIESNGQPVNQKGKTL